METPEYSQTIKEGKRASQVSLEDRPIKKKGRIR